MRPQIAVPLSMAEAGPEHQGPVYEEWDGRAR